MSGDGNSGEHHHQDSRRPHDRLPGQILLQAGETGVQMGQRHTQVIGGGKERST